MSEADRKLLELAAKAAAAAGLPIIGSVAGPQILYRTSPKKIEFYRQWNPRDDDGDSFRLSAHARITLSIYEEWGVAIASWTQAGVEPWDENRSIREPLGEDIMTAARLAVLRAAAAIGEAMP